MTPSRGPLGWERDIALADAVELERAWPIGYTGPGTGAGGERALNESLESAMRNLEARVAPLGWDIWHRQWIEELRAEFWGYVALARRALYAVEGALVMRGLRAPPSRYPNADPGAWKALALEDHATLVRVDAIYGSSWRRRGGVGAFMVGIRKWDRITQQLHDRDLQARVRPTSLVRAVELDHGRADGIHDDIRDLRRYLLLWAGGEQRRLTGEPT